MKEIFPVIILLFLIGFASCCVQEDVKEVIKGPVGKVSIYKGIWLPFSREREIAINEMDEIKLDNLNIVAIGIRICYEGVITECDDEEEIKDVINEFHKNGIRTLLMLNPAHGDFGIDPFSNEASGKPMLDKLTPLVLKWAAIAEEYEVEIFCPVNEPQLLSYQNVYDVENWAREILPEIKSVYNGKLAFRVHNIPDYGFYEYDLDGYDYILPTLFSCSSDIDQEEGYRNHLIDVNIENLASLKNFYPDHEYLAFEINAFTGPDYYWWEPIAPENMKNNTYNISEDFFVVSLNGQASCFEMFFNLSWSEASGYFISVYKGFEYRHKPAEAVIRNWFGD